MVRIIRGSLGRYSARNLHSERKQRLAPPITPTSCDDCCDLLLQGDGELRAKEEKILIAIQKIRAADIKKVKHFNNILSYFKFKEGSLL